MPLLVLAVLTLLLAVATTGFMMRAARDARVGAVPPGIEVQDHVLYGALYVNDDDPRGWVPRTNGAGRTPNFRTQARAKAFLMLVATTFASALALTVASLT